jgi:hypothetical protein
MQVVPIQAVPSQVVNVALGGQACKLNIRQTSTGVFMDVYVNEALIIGGVACENKNRIVHSAYLGFIGDLAFFDTQGADDPDYTGMGTRWILLYLAPGDIVWPPQNLVDTPPFTPLPIPPSAPTGLLATPAFEQNTITWDTVAGMTYNLYWATAPGVTPATGTKISGAASGYVHSGLSDNTRYYYVLEVNDAYGNSALSSEVSGLTLPGAPVGLSATTGVGQATISATQVAGLQYNLYYSTTPGVTPATGTKVTGWISPYDLPGLVGGTEYYFVATAVNATGEGPACAEVNCTPGGYLLFANPSANASVSNGGLTGNIAAVQYPTEGTIGPSGYASAGVIRQCEFTILSKAATAYGAVGLANSSYVHGSPPDPGRDVAGNSLGRYFAYLDNCYYKNVNVATVSIPNVGDVIGMVINAAATQIDTYRNGILDHTQGITASDTAFGPVMSGCCVSTPLGTSSIGLNTGQSPFAYPVAGAVGFYT